jgi:transcription antitermination protein NusB
MGARTSGREAALQMLFALETTGESPERVIQLFWRSFEGHPEARDYAETLVRGVAAALADVDERLRAASINWRLERMTRVDRNILRLGTWELLERPDVPRAVVLDEAVELAKRFGTEDSSSFVNGVLDRVAETAGRRGLRPCNPALLRVRS